jgi:hypothetical protein
MGQGPSTASGSIRKRLLDTTQTTRDIIDVILGYLLGELQIRDFYLLSSPTECKRYVLFLANRISSEFVQFQIEPTVDKSGTIAFRSVKDLTEPSEPDRKKRQFLCLELAYFYVRIFQIYGALAFTLLDDASYTQQRGYTSFIRAEGAPLKPAGMTPFRTSAKGPIRYKLTRKTGGTVSDSSSLRIFRFLNEALEDIRSEGVSRSTYRVDTGGKPNATFTILDSNKGVFTVYLTEKRTYKLTVSARESIASGQVTMTLETVQIGTGGSSISVKSLRDDEDELVLTKYNYTFQPERRRFERDGKMIEQTYWTLSDDTSVTDTIRSILEKITPYAQARLKESGDTNVFEISNRIGIPKKNLEKGGIFEEREGVDERLKIARTIDNLTRKRPIAHCVSRGLQLLDVLPLGADTGVVESKICDTKFLENKISIPMGKPLSSSGGIMALASLFYSFVEQATPKIIQGSEEAKEYLTFVQTMGSMFIKRDSTGRAPESVKSFSEISSTERDQYYCAGSTRVELPAKFARERVYPIIQSLFQRQITHASNCMQVLEQLFVIRKIGKDEVEIHIHPNIFKKGLPEINRISRITRNLLVKYYQDCEMDYIKGLETIKSFRDIKPATTMPVKS